MNAKSQQKGFTIIEVVLVLAIAALIFLMIFIALPALQRGQRDTARKQDQNKVATAITTWRGNHRGALPGLDDGTTKAQFINDYVDTLGQYSVDDQTFVISDDAPTSALTDEQIMVVLGYQCARDGNNNNLGDASKRSAAIYIRLEASKAVVCTDS